MALPPSNTQINSAFIAYLDAVSKGDNPEGLHSVVCFFDAQDARVYCRSDSTATPLEFGQQIPHPPQTALRLDTVTSMVYTSNPTCRFVMINGRLTLVCA